MTTRPIHRLRLLTVPLFMLILTLITSSAAFADSNPGSTVVNGAGSVTESMTAPTIPTVTLAGINQTINYTLPLTVVDATGTGNGWNLTITSTTFTTGGGTPHTLATNASRIESIEAACAAGSTCTDPSNAVTYPLALPAGASAPSAVKFFNADAATGLGKFTITPTISIAIPANTYASSSGYSSTITVAVVSGP